MSERNCPVVRHSSSKYRADMSSFIFFIVLTNVVFLNVALAAVPSQLPKDLLANYDKSMKPGIKVIKRFFVTDAVAEKNCFVVCPIKIFYCHMAIVMSDTCTIDVF
jgi:hypothetical protein